MEITLPGWIARIAQRFTQERKDFYVVGGALRDQLLGRESREWDVATNARPDKVLELLKVSGAKAIGTVGKRFGTITARIENDPIEITTYRSEQYAQDSRQPTVAFGDSLEEDLARRDFTVNALAYDPIQKITIDKVGGQADLAAKLIRAVGNGRDRFNEDPLRMLRAIRFAVELEFEIEPKTFAAIASEKERFAILSVERIQQELNKILLSARPSRGIELLRESGLIAYILPELLPSIDIEFDPREHKDIYHHILQVLDNTPPKLELRWCALLHDIAKPLTRKKIAGEWHFLGHENVGAKMAKQILSRLRYPNDFVIYVNQLVYLHQRIPNDAGDWSDGAIRRFVRDAGAALDDLFTFAEADSTGKNERKLALYQARRAKLRERIVELERLAEIAKIASPLSGEELMELFHRPAGPWIKPIKEELLRQVLDGELGPDDKAKAKTVAKSLIADNTKR